MGSYGVLKGPMGSYRDLRAPTWTLGVLWGLEGSFVDLWGPMVCYGDPRETLWTYWELWGPL